MQQRWPVRAVRVWGRYWLLPLIPLIVTIGLTVFGKARLVHWALAAISIALAASGLRGRRLWFDLSPYLAVALGYDLLRYIRPLFVTEQRVIGCGLRDVELALFSFGGDRTIGEALSAQHTPFWDLVCAVPYTIFIYVVFGYGAYLFFRDRPRMRRYVVGFAAANYLAFVVWLTAPVAPPWYVHAHGCAIDAMTLPNPGGLARVDALLGIHYFATFYGQASAVFGAMPSLHCAYPLIGLITAWRASAKTRVVHVFYCIWMALSAMYLDHHWFLDVIGGWATAIAAVWIADRVLAWATRLAAQEANSAIVQLAPAAASIAREEHHA